MRWSSMISSAAILIIGASLAFGQPTPAARPSPEAAPSDQATPTGAKRSACRQEGTTKGMQGAPAVSIPWRVPFRSGSARLGRSQKDGLPLPAVGETFVGSRPSTRAHKRNLAAAPIGQWAMAPTAFSMAY